VSVTIRIPRKIAEKAEELSVDLESLVLETILRELKLDPNEEAEIRLELAEKSLKEAKSFMEKNDPTQASEKLYKAVEECVKILSQLYKLP